VNETYTGPVRSKTPGKIWEDGHVGWHTQFNQKFAELIVQECLGDFKERIATRYQGSDKDRDIAYGMEIVYFSIIDKFGIDE
jgi:hypothetical protein